MTLVLALVAWVHARPLALDPARSTVRAHARASLHDFEIEATSFTGSLDPSEGTGTLDLAVAGLRSGVGPRDARMRGWCLDERTHPLVRYAVRGVEGDVAGVRAGVGSGEIVLQGDLQLRETTRPLAVPASYAWEGGALRLRGRVPLRWSDWGIPDPAVAIATLGPELTIAFDVLTVAAPDPAVTASVAGAGAPVGPDGAFRATPGEGVAEGGRAPLPPQKAQAKAVASKKKPSKATKKKAATKKKTRRKGQ